MLKNLTSSALAIAATLLLASCASHKMLPPVGTARIENPTSEALIAGWEKMGFKKGEQVPDFTLFSNDEKPFTLSEELRKKKPIVLINASYTCDVTRGNLESILGMAKDHRKDATFFIVYTTEAHPVDVASPYSTDPGPWIAKDNVRDKVSARQPKTYAERQALADKWKDTYSIPMTVLVDNPDNFFWTKFGQAPNMVYIIAPDRTVLFKQAWFGKGGLEKELEKLGE